MALYWNPAGSRRRGRPCKTWRRGMKKELVAASMIMGEMWTGGGPEVERSGEGPHMSSA